MTRKLTSPELNQRKNDREKRRKKELQEAKEKAAAKAKFEALPEVWELKLTVHKRLMMDVRSNVFIRKLCGDAFMGMADELLISLLIAWEENKSELVLVPRAEKKKVTKPLTVRKSVRK